MPRDETPDWLTIWRKVVIMKDREEWNDVNNIRSMIYMGFMRKIFTAILSDN